MWWIVLVVATNPLLPSRTVVVDHVDRIEINHVYDGDGNHVLDQVIFWDWIPGESDFQVVDWRLLKDVRDPITDRQRHAWRIRPCSPPPVGRWRGGHAYPRPVGDDRYVSEWFDGRHEVWRKVSSPLFLRTWTSYDRELVERGRNKRKLLSPHPNR